MVFRLSFSVFLDCIIKVTIFILNIYFFRKYIHAESGIFIIWIKNIKIIEVYTNNVNCISTESIITIFFGIFKVLAQCKWGQGTIKPTNQLLNSAFERIDRTKEREKTDMRATTCNSFERKSNNPFEREKIKKPLLLARHWVRPLAHQFRSCLVFKHKSMGVLFTRNFTNCESYGYLYPFPPWIVEVLCPCSLSG